MKATKCHFVSNNVPGFFSLMSSFIAAAAESLLKGKQWNIARPKTERAFGRSAGAINHAACHVFPAAHLRFGNEFPSTHTADSSGVRETTVGCGQKKGRAAPPVSHSDAPDNSCKCSNSPLAGT